MQTFVILWMPGPRWIETASIYDQPCIEEHADHIGTLMAERRVVLSGPFTSAAVTLSSSVGMSVVKAVDEAGLRAWLAEDPGIVHEVLTAEVHPFQIVFEAQDAGRGADRVTP
jgi:uncharacterized protein YciI